METTQQLLEQIILHTPNYVFWKDVHSIYRGCNNNFARLAQLETPDHILGKRDEDLPWSAYSEIYRQEDQYVILSGHSIYQRTVPFMINTQQEMFLSITKSPLYNKDRIVGIFCSFVDVTAKVHAQRFKLEYEEAEKRVEYLRTAAGSIAHELRTPLASIKMAAQSITKFWNTLFSGYKLAKDASLTVDDINSEKLSALEYQTQSILHQTHFANSFIDLILDNLKEHKEFDSSRYCIIDVHDVIKKCLANYPFTGNEHTLIHINPSHDFTLFGDEFLIINAFNNLLRNSLYYIRQARKGSIYIWFEHSETYNKIYFKDTAIGASPEIIEKLFDNFYSRRQGGTGLGLSFCKKIMSNLGGEITAESVEGEYITFVLSFPKVMCEAKKVSNA